MHIQTNKATVWHSYAKVKAGVAYGIITKRVDGVVTLTLKNVYPDRKQAKKAVNIECQRLTKETSHVTL
jgi:hypothetical protein